MIKTTLVKYFIENTQDVSNDWKNLEHDVILKCLFYDITANYKKDTYWRLSIGGNNLLQDIFDNYSVPIDEGVTLNTKNL